MDQRQHSTEFNFQQRQQIFLVSKMSTLALMSNQPSVQWIQGSLHPGIKQLGQEVDQSPSSGTEVKNDRSYTSTPSLYLLGVDRDKFNLVHYLVVHRDKLFNILFGFCFTHFS